jgi:5-methylcytosine-specific restriction endonuclease McrA
MSYIPDALREEVVLRANGCCEYCHIHQDDSLYTHEIDHIIPEKHRGNTELDNLCLACLDCNRYKGTDFGSFDPDTGAVELLYNPRQQIWDDHYRLESAFIEPLSATGRVTVFVLNEDMRLGARLALINAAAYPCSR